MKFTLSRCDIRKMVISLKVLEDNDPGPYWVMRQPLMVNKGNWVYNKAAVLAVMKSTMKNLYKKLDWQSIYKKQLLDILDIGFAREVSETE